MQEPSTYMLLKKNAANPSLVILCLLANRIIQNLTIKQMIIHKKSTVNYPHYGLAKLQVKKKYFLDRPCEDLFYITDECVCMCKKLYILSSKVIST